MKIGLIRMLMSAGKLKDLLSLSIRARLFISISLILLLLITITLISVYSLNNSKSNIHNLVELDQPLLLKSVKLSSLIIEGHSMLGFYVSTKEEQYKTRFKSIQQQQKKLLDEMKQQQDVEAEFMAKVDFLLKQENQIVDKIFKFTVSNAINEPAFQFAAENFNSLSQQILQKLSEAIDAENNEEATDERKVLHHSLHQVRYAWANVMNGLRGFLAFKADNNKDEVINYLEAFQTEMGRVNKKSDIFTLEQEDSILFINEARNNLKEKFDKMTEIHTGKKGRMDAFFIRDQLGPVTKQLKIVIDDFITARKNKTTSSSTSVLSEVDNTMMLSIGLLVFSILLGVGIYLFSIVTIARPIDEIVLAMEDIAQGEGDLKKRMDVKGRDELAKLSTAFNAFISRIHSMFTDVRGVSLEMSKASSTLNSVTNENRNGIEQQHQETDLLQLRQMN